MALRRDAITIMDDETIRGVITENSVFGIGVARARKLVARKAKRATKTEFIVDATIISRMMVTSAFSNRTEFSVCTVKDLLARAHK
jgi:hypothetical protein